MNENRKFKIALDVLKVLQDNKNLSLRKKRKFFNEFLNICEFKIPSLGTFNDLERLTKALDNVQ